MSDALKLGFTDNDDFKEFKVPQEKVYNIYLNEKELLAIYKLPVPSYLERSRDLFIIGCYTGMRVENYLNIDPEINVDLNTGFITAIINKNGPKVKIPIHWTVREIYEKYNGFPKSISEQQLNKNIKLIGAAAGIKENIISVKTFGGERKEIVKPKYKMITTHTARRSLVTNLYLKNVPIKYIMSITGHQSEAQCLNYIKTTIEEMADKVAELDFWKK